MPAAYPYPQVPVTRLLDDAAKDFPETEAIDALGHRLTYRELLDQVDRLATALRHLGVGPGDRVGLLLPQSPQHLIAFFAGLRAGATVVLLDPDAGDLADTIGHTGCRVLVCLSPDYGRLAAQKDRLSGVRHILATGIDDYLPFPRNVLFPVSGRREGVYRRVPRDRGVTGFKDLIRRTAPEPVAVGMEVPAVIVDRFVYSHAALVAGAFQLRLWVPDVQAGRERLLNLTTGASPFGLGVTLGLGVLAASTVVYPMGKSARDGRGGGIVRALARARPTLLAADPARFAGVADDVGRLEALRLGLVAGPVDPATVTAIHDATGARIRGGLGAAGVPGLAHANPVYGRAVAESVGLALPDTRTAVLDPTGREVAVGEVGTVGVRGPQVAGGCWEDPTATAAAFAGPWLRTEHRGHLDPEGYLWLEKQA